MDSDSLVKQHIKKNKTSYLIGAALLSISSLFQLLIPKVLETFTDLLEAGTLGMEGTFQFAIWIALVGLAVAFFRSTSRIFLFRLSRILDKNTKRRLFAHWEKLSSTYFDRQRIGDLMSRAINDVNVVREVAMSGIFMSTEAFVMISISLVAMAYTTNVWLTVLVFLPLPGLTFLGYKFRGQIHQRATRVQEAISQLTSRVQEFCSGIRIVKTYVQEKQEMDQFTKDNHHNVVAHQSLIKANSMFVSISQGIVGLSFLFSIVFGGIMVMRGQVTLGQFVAFNAYLSFLVVPLENVGKVMNTLQRGKAADQRLKSVLGTQVDVKDEEGVKQIHTLSGEISIQNLTFTYPESSQPSLKNINLEVEAGSSLAIVGRVGSGKTTLVNLLLRLYNPPKGTIRLDGHELYEIPLKTLRSNIGYVPQEYFLFSTTISENIAFDPQPHLHEDVEKAARIAHVHHNIVEFPKKFETPLGERGASLSGGQRQRISMARALIKKPAILIFDDSLSSVDAETEKKILSGLQKVMKNRTSIIVSHRISAIREADQIIVLDKGEIVEQGNHRQLVRLGGIYANMHEQQQLNREMEG